MSFSLSDAFKFELFHGKDILKRLKDDPKRLILGVDPASTEVWNKILGRDDEAIVNQLGGAKGESKLGFGGGGVFDRAEAAGINPSSGKKMQDIAAVIASIYGGAGAAKGLGNVGGGEGLLGGRGKEFFNDPKNVNQLTGLLNQGQQEQPDPASPYAPGRGRQLKRRLNA